MGGPGATPPKMVFLQATHHENLLMMGLDAGANPRQHIRLSEPDPTASQVVDFGNFLHDERCWGVDCGNKCLGPQRVGTAVFTPSFFLIQKRVAWCQRKACAMLGRFKPPSQLNQASGSVQLARGESQVGKHFGLICTISSLLPYPVSR